VTKWQEFPLRPQGRPWAGLNTRSGKLDDGSGQMTDSSVNCIINEADKLAKRKGMIRGIDERFAGSVCGLHKYTDECGREWLVVADEGGFSVRQPFAIPSFTSSDAYPSDDFEDDGPVNTYFWRNTGGYEQAGSALVLKAGETQPGPMLWFKPASNFSYQVEIGYTIDDDSTVAVHIKRGITARIEARLARVAGNGIVTLVWIDSSGSETELGTGGVSSVAAGRMILTYERDTVNDRYLAQLDVTPEGAATFRIADFTTINALGDADLGQGTALELLSSSGASSGSATDVQGDPV
jgi:hypothetical protein